MEGASPLKICSTANTAGPVRATFFGRVYESVSMGSRMHKMQQTHGGSTLIAMDLDGRRFT